MHLIRPFLLSFYLFSATCCQAAQLLVTQPSGQTIDKEVVIRVEQLLPKQKITLKAEAEDRKGQTWSSFAIFQADSEGCVDLRSCRPMANSSYENVDGMGLFWSMTPVKEDISSSFNCKNDGFDVKLSLYIDGKFSEKKAIIRYLKAPNVSRIEVRENGLVGTLFMPPAKTPLPIIITLSGSNGGLSETRAKLLASNGFSVLALGYFGVDHLPSNLQDIPLEYFEQAFTWLGAQPSIDSSRLGIYGVSRGAELSLILGSFFPDSINAIVAVSPSSVVYGGLCETPVDAWVYNNEPILPFASVPKTDFGKKSGQTPESSISTRQDFLKGMKEKEVFEMAAIPVEKIRCPVLLISGGDDQMWPSELYANQIKERLSIKGSRICCRHLNYEKAGHGINIPNLPIPNPTYYHPIVERWFSMGGSRASDAEASADSWIKLVDFFHKTLSSLPAPYENPIDFL